MMKPHRPPTDCHYLPLTTGRIGLSQTTDHVEFYDSTNHVSHGRVHWRHRRPAPCAPGWAPPQWDCDWMRRDCGCGCSMGCSGTRLFAAMLVDARWWPQEEPDAGP
jgi:hypothetical protein